MIIIEFYRGPTWGESTSCQILILLPLPRLPCYHFNLHFYVLNFLFTYRGFIFYAEFDVFSELILHTEEHLK